MSGDELREAINAAISGVATHRRQLTVYMDDSGRAPRKGRSRARQPHHVKGDIHEAVSAVLDRALKSVTAGRPSEAVAPAVWLDDLDAIEAEAGGVSRDALAAALRALRFEVVPYKGADDDEYRQHTEAVAQRLAAALLPTQASDSPEKTT